jgi:hypothetical protein
MTYCFSHPRAICRLSTVYESALITQNKKTNTGNRKRQVYNAAGGKVGEFHVTQKKRIAKESRAKKKTKTKSSKRTQAIDELVSSAYDKRRQDDLAHAKYVRDCMEWLEEYEKN